MNSLSISILPGLYAICRLAPGVPLPPWASPSEVMSITRTPEELSVVCEQKHVPATVTCERDWRCLKVEGPLDLSLTGILASLAAPLAQAQICLFAISTYDTDYVLIKDNDLQNAVSVLGRAGHNILLDPGGFTSP
jgi:hypothetical protein